MQRKRRRRIKEREHIKVNELRSGELCCFFLTWTFDPARMEAEYPLIMAFLRVLVNSPVL